MTTPETVAPDPRPLLAAYQAVILEIDKLPRVPRLRLFVRFFVRYHVNRSIVALWRLYNVGAALNPDAPSYEAGARQVEAFGRSLPPHRPRLALVALLLSVPRRPEQNGRSLGKELLGLRVVRMHSDPPTAARLLFREVVLKG